MADYFALLRQPRLPALDPEQIKHEFLRLSTEAHPDKAAPAEKADAGERFAALNLAFNTLRHTRTRLVHLLELEGVPSAPHVQTAPPETLEFFAPIAELTRAADEFLSRKRQASSPMLQAQLFQEGLDWTERVQDLQSRVHQRIASLEAELPALNSDPRRHLPRLQQIAAALGFLERWHAQLQERLTSLAL